MNPSINIVLVHLNYCTWNSSLKSIWNLKPRFQNWRGILTFPSTGESSPDVATNAGSIDWLGHGQGQGSKVGSLSRIGSQPMWISLSASVCGSVLGSSHPSCRPWERGDLLRRLSTFQPTNWFGKPKFCATSFLSYARRGWVNVDIDKIECESCGATLKYVAPDSWTPTECDICYNLAYMYYIFVSRT
ncbi:unnamed protein product [Lactuca saligna]|uniref:C3HC-type domain-containing protein n=1 Tax=Lactuca saligna TaxID=75948 RepID=A0AA36E467_LACSI|nr:unnamed protein product [Lactuca saligna]